MTDNLENKVDYTVHRSVVESVFSRTFTDEEWGVLACEIESILDHYVWLDLPSKIEDLEWLVEQDRKYS